MFFLRQAGRATRKRQRPAYFLLLTPGAHTEDVLTSDQIEQFRVLLEEFRGELIQQVESALDRLDKGEFGICVRCEEEMALARLRVRPEATLCLNCAEKRA